MFSSIGFTLAGLLYILIIGIFYASKKKYTNVASKLFAFYLKVCIIFSIYEICYCLAVYFFINTNPTLCKILARIYMLFCCFDMALIYLYIKSNVKGQRYLKFSEMLTNNFVIFSLSLVICSMVMSLFTSIDFELIDKWWVVKGTYYVPLYVLGFYGFSFIAKSIILDLKGNTRNRVVFSISFILFFLAVVVHIAFYRYTMCSLFCDTVLVSLYFLVESQDSYLVNELNDERRRADKADGEKRDFLAKISHEIRTPMNTIIGLSDNLLDQGQSIPSQEAMQDMKNIYSAGKSLLDVVNNIILYSQIENGNEKISEEEYSIVDVFNELSGYANSMMDKRRVSFVYDVNPNIPSKYYGDREKVFRILLNLLSNAIKFTNDGKITISLLADKMENGSVSLLFIVKDTGSGIKDNKIDYLFNEVKSSSMMNGSGLGLVLTKKLVDLLGGSIKYESKEGMGSSFSVIINQKVASLDPIGDVNSLYAQKINEFSYFDCSNYRMLIVDDNEIDLKVLERLLRFYRIRVDLINNGQDALEMYKLNRYDIIIVDHLMPGMDGIDTLKAFKRFKKVKTPPVIVMTANVVTELKDTYFKVGFSDYLTKPVDVNELNNLMKKYFNKDEVR